MKTKFLLGALGLTVAFAACTNEDVIETNVNNSALEGRKVVDLELVTGVESRLSLENGIVGWDDKDKIGSILVDPTTQWTVAGTAHIGNNRWDRVGNGFTTQGTTVEGAWMFYYPYSDEMSKNRGALKTYNKSLVNQKYDADGAKMYENDFRISPVYFVNAAEGEAKIDVDLSSVYSYGNIQAALPADAAGAKVSKVLIKFGENMKDEVIIDASKVARIASMNYAYITEAPTQQNPDGKTPVNLFNTYKQWWNVDSVGTSKEAAATAVEALQDWVNGDEYLKVCFSDIAVDEQENTLEYILIDCKDAPALADTMFTTRVLLPAGVVEKDINVYFYTNKGVYNSVVEADENNPVYFKRQTRADLHNVNRIEDTELEEQPKYLTTQEANATSTPIVETEDLVNLIKQFVANNGNDAMDVTYQLMGTVVLNDAVAEALANNKDLRTITVENISIECTKNQAIKKLVATGEVTIKSGSNITIGGAWNVNSTIIEEGAVVTVAEDCNGETTTVKGSLIINNSVNYAPTVTVKSGSLTLGTATTKDESITAKIAAVETGSLTINVNTNNTVATTWGKVGINVAALTVAVNDTLTCDNIEVQKNATVTVDAVLAINANAGTITNNAKELTVAENNGTINNNSDATAKETKGAKVVITTNSEEAVVNTVKYSQTNVDINSGTVNYVEGAFVNILEAGYDGQYSEEGNVIYTIEKDMTAEELAAIMKNTKVTAITIENAKLTFEKDFEIAKLAALRNVVLNGNAEIVANEMVTLHMPIYVYESGNKISGSSAVVFTGYSQNEGIDTITLYEDAELIVEAIVAGAWNITLEENASVMAYTNVYGYANGPILGTNASWIGTLYEKKTAQEIATILGLEINN